MLEYQIRLLQNQFDIALAVYFSHDLDLFLSADQMGWEIRLNLLAKQRRFPACSCTFGFAASVSKGGGRKQFVAFDQSVLERQDVMRCGQIGFVPSLFGSEPARFPHTVT